MDNLNDDFGFNKDGELSRLLGMLNDIRNSASNGEISGMMKNVNEEPYKVEKLNVDGVDFIIKHWFHPHGDYKTMHVMGDEDLINQEDLEDNIMDTLNKNNGLENLTIKNISLDINRDWGKSPSLEEQLDKAVKAEEYELACELRDLIKERDVMMKIKITELNEALEKGDLDLSERLLAELKKIKYDFI